MDIKRYKFFPIFLLTLFLAYQASVTMFSHVHYVNGVMIIHSHPNQDQDHTHTEAQILTIAQTANFVGVEPCSYLLDFVNWDVVCEYEINGEVSFICECDAQQIRLRAPPVQC